MWGNQPIVVLVFNIILAVVAFLFYRTYADSLRGIPHARVATPPSQLNISAFIEAQAFPTMVVNRDGSIVHLNQNMCDSFANLGSHRSKDQYLEQHFSTLIRNPQVLDAYEQVELSKKNTEFHFEPQHDGDRYFWAHISSTQSKNHATLYIFTFRDLTKDQKIERMRADFVANASHELRTPLASISGFIETLQNSAKDDEKARSVFLPIMHEQAERMTRMIDDLLSLSKIEMNIHSKPKDKVNLARISQHVLSSAAPKASNKRVELIFENETEEAYIKGDADQLTQLLSNLVDNALKYGLKNGKDNKIILRLRDHPFKDQIMVSVIDFGHGIPKTDLPRLTERFYRVSNQHKEKGTGLGLAIVKHIVQRHEGEILFKSQLDKGTKVEINFHKF